MPPVTPPTPPTPPTPQPARVGAPDGKVRHKHKPNYTDSGMKTNVASGSKPLYLCDCCGSLIHDTETHDDDRARTIQLTVLPPAPALLPDPRIE